MAAANRRQHQAGQAGVGSCVRMKWGNTASAWSPEGGCS